MRKLILENVWLKIASVVLAVILWSFVISRGQSEISLDAPLELRDMPKGLESIKQSDRTISVSVKGQERLLKNMKTSDVRVQLDLSKAKAGKGTYSISSDDVKLPFRMTVTNINPPSVWVVLEETAERKVSVNPVIVGSPEKGFSVGSVEVIPKYVNIEGAKSEVDRIKYLRTEQIDIADIDKTLTQDVKLDTAGRNIRTDVPEVKVKVVIKSSKSK